MGDSKATTSSSDFANRQLQQKIFLFLFLSLSLSCVSVQQYLYTHYSIALSHIYTYMTLGLFTNMAMTGTLETYLQICP